MASIFQVLPGLRSAAPRLARHFFTCHECRPAPSTLPLTRSAFSRPILQRARKFYDARKSSRSVVTLVSKPRVSSPLSELSKVIADGTPRKSFFPETSDKIVAYWLLGSAASVFGIVVFGGLTRLTESGYGRNQTSAES